VLLYHQLSYIFDALSYIDSVVWHKLFGRVVAGDAHTLLECILALGVTLHGIADRRGYIMHVELKMMDSSYNLVWVDAYGVPGGVEWRVSGLGRRGIGGRLLSYIRVYGGGTRPSFDIAIVDDGGGARVYLIRRVKALGSKVVDVEVLDAGGLGGAPGALLGEDVVEQSIGDARNARIIDVRIKAYDDKSIVFYARDEQLVSNVEMYETLSIEFEHYKPGVDTILSLTTGSFTMETSIGCEEDGRVNTELHITIPDFLDCGAKRSGHGECTGVARALIREYIYNILGYRCEHIEEDGGVARAMLASSIRDYIDAVKAAREAIEAILGLTRPRRA
jgi:hypothetical protein